MTEHPRFFELSDDVHVPHRWDLGTPTDEQGRVLNDAAFRSGEPVALSCRPRIPIREHDGQPLDFTEVGLAVPLVSAKAAAVFSELAPRDVQLIPVDVEAHPEPFFILVCTRRVKCIDEQRSSFVESWRPEDGRPEKQGHYRVVSGMLIDPTKVDDAQVFRTWGWEVLLVSETIKRALDRVGATGPRFTDVTGPSAPSAEQKERQRQTQERRERVDTARDAFWRTLGTLDSAIIPIAAYGAWPGQRQVWRVIQRPNGQTLLVTDGLSDFFVDREEDSVGFGLELALETDATFKQLYKSWPVRLLSLVSTAVSDGASVRERLLAGLFTLEVPGEGMPKTLVTREGRVGVLLGLRTPSLPEHFTLPAGEVKLVTVKVLLPGELDFVRERGTEGQAELARRFLGTAEQHLSRARR